jgi:hypothetical protein
VFPLAGIGLCFQILPLVPFYAVSAVCLLQDPLLTDYTDWTSQCVTA